VAWSTGGQLAERLVAPVVEQGGLEWLPDLLVAQVFLAQDAVGVDLCTALLRAVQETGAREVGPNTMTQP